MHDVEFDVVANQYSLRPRADPGAVIAHSGAEGNHVVASRRIAAGSLVLRARGFDLPLGHEQDPSVLLQAVLSKCAVVRYCLLSYGSNPSHMREASYGLFICASMRDAPPAYLTWPPLWHPPLLRVEIIIT